MQARILVIINEPVLAEKILANLESFEYVLLPLATRSEDAIRSIERDDPDLVILDLEFSGDMDGVTLAETIHNRFDRPMIFVTESSKNLSLKRVQLTNPYGFVLKDFDPYRFSVVITIALQKYFTEKQLRDSEDRLRMIADFTYDWEYWMDDTGHFVYMSPSVERVTGYTVDEFNKNPGLLQEIVHPLDKQKSDDHSNQRKINKGITDFKLRIIKKDG
ncbi:MAG TPA: response regulator, partial [Leptolinea sp.]